MSVSLGIVILVVAVALFFDFTNGFHDAANAIATIVATKTMSFGAALGMAAVFNILGALFTTAVATTIEKGIIRDVGDPLNTQIIVLSALGGAILWNFLTWLVGMPSSSSHALMGGLVGAGVAYQSSHEIIVSSIVNKVLYPMALSPLFGALVAGLLVVALRAILRRRSPEAPPRLLKHLHLAAGALMAFSYSSNDAQKTMGVITLALIGAHFLPADSPVPWWVIVLCALAMALGTLCGGRRIIETAGSRITILDQEKGFAANIGASITILICSRFGFPIATTQVVIGAITGAGLAGPPHRVNRRTWQRMLITWLFTLPGSAGMAMLLYLALERILS